MGGAEIVIESYGLPEFGFGFCVAFEDSEQESDLVAHLGGFRSQAGGFLKRVEGAGGVAFGYPRAALRDKLLDRFLILSGTERGSAQKKRPKQLGR
jgi:hypothetical protein